MITRKEVSVIKAAQKRGLINVSDDFIDAAYKVADLPYNVEYRLIYTKCNNALYFINMRRYDLAQASLDGHRVENKMVRTGVVNSDGTPVMREEWVIIYGYNR